MAGAGDGDRRPPPRRLLRGCSTFCATRADGSVRAIASRVADGTVAPLVTDAVAQADRQAQRVQQRVEFVRDGGLGHLAEAQGADGDAELGAGRYEGQLAHAGQSRLRAALSFGRRLLWVVSSQKGVTVLWRVAAASRRMTAVV